MLHVSAHDIAIYLHTERTGQSCCGPIHQVKFKNTNPVNAMISKV